MHTIEIHLIFMKCINVCLQNIYLERKEHIFTDFYQSILCSVQHWLSKSCFNMPTEAFQFYAYTYIPLYGP